MQRLIIFTFLLIVTPLFIGGCNGTPAQDTVSQSNEPVMMVIAPWARASLTDGGNSVIYLNIMNQGGADDVLLSASTAAAEAAELHETKMDENDVMQMSPLTHVAVPAASTVSFEPGGKHIMLIGLTETLRAGDKLTVTLTFEKAGEMVVEAEVREVGE